MRRKTRRALICMVVHLRLLNLSLSESNEFASIYEELYCCEKLWFRIRSNLGALRNKAPGIIPEFNPRLRWQKATSTPYHKLVS
jgi:hypothetical protein